MKFREISVAAIVVLSLHSSSLIGQQKASYLDTNLSAEQRAADLVHQMTLEEKASQLVNQARAIPRLGVPAYDWWSESLHGVAREGVTEFPEPVGLAATFDPAAIHRMAVVVGTEGRVKHEMAVKANGGQESAIFEGLDFWAPNINIFRDPRWGRGQETYGEDPFLTARMGVAFVTGMQGDDPKYYRVISTPKHYAVHSGPESTRHTADVTVSKHDELDTYLPAFRAAVIEGKADSVMCAYNDINGQPACANEFLLKDQLRGKWGFKGYVVSDCGAIVDVYRNHHFEPSQPQASAISLQRGMDNECVDFTFKVKDDHDYKPYVDAVKEGHLKESEIDTAVERLFTARMKLGMFDPPEMVPYKKIPDSELNSAAHREMAHVIANESMVLLKNDGTLPIQSNKKILVVGPLAEQTKVLLGNYNGTPTHTVSVLEGMRKVFGDGQIKYEAGTQFLSHEAEAVPASALTSNGKPGVHVGYSKLDMSNVNNVTGTKSIAERTDPVIDVTAHPLPSSVAELRPLSVQWDGMLTAKDTGDYNLGLKANGFFRIKVDGKNVTSSYGGDANEAKLGRVHLEAGKPATLHVEYAPPEKGTPVAQLVWARVDMTPRPEAISAARNADVIVTLLGISSELEGEEMEVSEPGFKGGDRTSIDLPKPEEELLEALVASGKPVVLVLTNGSALAVNWAKDHANAILDAWYPGEEGGTAIAETLSGKNNPAGRLPVTFYTGVDQLPPFDSYAMQGRTYRYFKGAPLYPFGYGLSYTSFSYSDLKLPASATRAGDPLSIDVAVTNKGKIAGDEVAQLYLTFPEVAGAPLRALRGFQRVHLDAGQSQTLHFDLKDRDLSMVSDAGEPIVAAGKYLVSVGGGQPDTIAPGVKGAVEITGTVTLPE